MLALAIASIEELATASAPVDKSEVEASITKIKSALATSATKQELEALTQWFTQVTAELRYAIALKPIFPEPFNPLPLIAQIENLTERIDNLPLAVLQQQLAEVQELIEGLDASAAELHDRTRNLAQMEQQLETVGRLSAVLQERTGHLLYRTRNLDEIQQQMPSLQQLVTGTAQTEDKTGVLGRLREEFSSQIDVAVEKRVAELNQLLKKIQPAYEYELVFDRSGSRKVLLEALQQAKHRLILVCPWLTSSGADYQVIQDCKAFLERGGKLDIGWGHLKDIDEEKIGVGFFYNSLDAFESLRNRYPNRCQLKLLGTHEKFLICDHSFAMLGSHNFLTSGRGATIIGTENRNKPVMLTGKLV